MSFDRGCAEERSPSMRRPCASEGSRRFDLILTMRGRPIKDCHFVTVCTSVRSSLVMISYEASS
jgi:hypothetical protein